MLLSHKIMIRLSECREALNGLLQTADRTPEQQDEMAKLTKEVGAKEPELRAALASEGISTETMVITTDPEVRERLELRGKSRVGAFVAAAINKQPVAGAEAEYAASMGCSALGMIPMSIFDRDRPEVRSGLELRAVTPGVDAQNTANPTAPFVFERSIANSVLGLAFPVVQAGVANYPVISTGAPAGAVAKGGAAVVTAAAVRLDTRSPKRIAGQFEIRVEDLATMPSLEDDLRVSLMGAASNAVDEQVISGDNAAPNLNGLFKQAADVAIAGAVETFATGVARFSKLVDGQYANSLADVRAVIGSETFGLYAGLFSPGNASLFDYLRDHMGGLAVSNRVPDKAANGQKGIAVLTAGVAPMRVPVWSNLEIVVDPYTQAGKGIRVVTVTTLIGDPHLPYGVATVKEVHPKLS